VLLPACIGPCCLLQGTLGCLNFEFKAFAAFLSSLLLFLSLSSLPPPPLNFFGSLPVLCFNLKFSVFQIEIPMPVEASAELSWHRPMGGGQRAIEPRSTTTKSKNLMEFKNCPRYGRARFFNRKRACYIRRSQSQLPHRTDFR
jgi:hypothetical protein